MNYFRCTVGGSGKGNTVTVTCAEEFAGLTITLAKTGKTYTKTCPSTAPYTVTFNGVENGTYTVSCTVDGEIYSETVIVQDISCVLNYGFKWQTWVDTASQLDSSDYDTLDEVLEDELALRELFLEHACVDYMASVGASNEDLETIIENDLCAKWINLSDYALDYLYANEVIADLMDEADKYFYGEWALMPQVPKMTSNSAPYGVASYSTKFGGDAYQPFSQSTSSSSAYWDTKTYEGAWLRYDFGKQVRVTNFKFITNIDRTDLNVVASLHIQGSNDAETWETLKDFTSPNITTNSVYDSLSTAGNYRYYQVLFDSYNYSSSGGNYAYCEGLQFYAWAPKGNVPKMTSNTAPYGEAIGTTQSSGYELYKAFDNNPSTFAQVKTVTTTGAWRGYKFVNPVNVRRVAVARTGTPAYTTNMKVQYSDDGSTWTDSGTTIADTSQGGVPIYSNVIDVGYHLYWRIYLVDISTGSTTSFGTSLIQFYGRELKVSVPVMTGDTAPYGEAFGSSLLASNYHYYNAFTPEGITVSSTKYGWLPASNETTDCYVGYDFGRKVKIAYVEVQEVAGSGSAANNSTVIEGSDDGINYSPMSESITITRTKTGYIISAAEHRYFRMFFSTISSTGNRGVICNFYGLDYSEKEFESGTTKKWLYDHGVELETINAVTSSDTTFVTKNADNVEVQTTTTGTNRIASAYAVVDTSSFNIARCKFGEVFNPTTNNIEFAVYSALPNYSQSSCSGYVYFANGNSDLPYNCSLDISSVNLAVGYISVASRSGSTGYVRDAKLFELWLE